MNIRTATLLAVLLIFLTGCVPYGYVHQRGYYGTGHVYHGYRRYQSYRGHYNDAYDDERCDNY